MIAAGKLNHRLNILQPIEDQDSDTGESTVVWSSLATVWGSFEPLSVKDMISAGTEHEPIVARSIIRYRTDINAKMRVRFRGIDYEIKGSPLPDKNTGNEYMTLMLTEITING